MMQHFIQRFTIQMAILEKSYCTFTYNIHEQIDQIKSHSKYEQDIQEMSYMLRNGNSVNINSLLNEFIQLLFGDTLFFRFERMQYNASVL